MTQSLTYVELDVPSFTPKLGFAANRARWADLSQATSPTSLMSRSGHRSWFPITSLYIYVQNLRNRPGVDTAEFGFGSSASIKASIEYPAGVFTQVLFSGGATATVPDKQILRSDLVTLNTPIPSATIFWVRQFFQNAGGVFFNSWQDSAIYGDAVHKTSATDQTMSGTVVDDSGWSFPPAAIIAVSNTVSVGVVGDTGAYGNHGPTGEAAPFWNDVGTIGKSIATQVPYQNLSIHQSRAYSGSSLYWVNSGQPRRELAQYCSHIICQLGEFDLWGVDGNTRTSAQLISDLSALWNTLVSTYNFTGGIYQATVLPRSSSTDGWTSYVHQTPSAESAEHTTFNNAVRLTLSGAIGFYEVAGNLESTVNSDIWRVVGGPNYADAFSQTFPPWSSQNASIVANAFAGPPGTTGNIATRFLENTTATVVHNYADSLVTTTSPTTGRFAFSMAIRATGTTRRAQLTVGDAAFTTNFSYVTFDLAGVQIGTSGIGGSGYARSVSGSSIVSLGSSWFLCTAVFDVTSAIATAAIYLDNGTGTGAQSITYTGNGASGFFVAQPVIQLLTALTGDGISPNDAGYQFIHDFGNITAPSGSGSAPFRFAIDADYLPLNIDCIPSIKEITFTPAIISLGTDLGQRASVSIKFKDHRHKFDGEAFSSGSFWGKWRARYGLKLRGMPLRVIRGTLGQALNQMETRNYTIDSTDGPIEDGTYTVIAKDILKLADGDRAQAPILSNGFLSANITNSATSFTLSPSGVGAEYASSGYVAIGGSEICSFTRSGDTLTITRGQYNTAAVAHNSQDRVQQCLEYLGLSVANIVRDLFVTFADVPSGYIDLTAWQNEASSFLSTVYSALIAEPTAVNTLISELIEQAGLAIWWDDVAKQIRFQVLRPIPTTANVFDQDNVMAQTLVITEQPAKRLSQIYFYFAKINPLVQEDQINNYRSTSLTIDATAEVDYQGSAIKKIFSRWVPTGGRAVAQKASGNILGRFRDPPRSFRFDLLRYSVTDPVLGSGYQLKGWPLQDTSGNAVQVPIQVVQLNPGAEKFEIVAEEMLFSGIASAPSSPDAPHVIIIDGNVNNINLRSVHDSIYATPVSGTVISCTINSGILVGSVATGTPAFDVGSWPGGVTISITNNGRIEGKGGLGGSGGNSDSSGPKNGGNGGNGGTALFTRQAINLTNNNQIWGGGGGGGGGGGTWVVTGFSWGGAGGGAGAGNTPSGGGAQGTASFGTAYSGTGGGDSTIDAPGGPGSPGTGSGFHAGAAAGGGGPGQAGATGNVGNGSINGSAGSGGAAGNAVDGNSFITYSANVDMRGPTIN